jgi:hypothetical protein
LDFQNKLYNYFGTNVSTLLDKVFSDIS